MPESKLRRLRVLALALALALAGCSSSNKTSGDATTTDTSGDATTSDTSGADTVVDSSGLDISGGDLGSDAAIDDQTNTTDTSGGEDAGPDVSPLDLGTSDAPTSDAIVPPDVTTSPGMLSAVWANNGQDKVVQSDLRASTNADSVKNSVWDGTTIRIFGARNEVVAFNLVLEAKDADVANVSVELTSLAGTGGSIDSTPAPDASGLYNWLKRPIELFYIRYLEIKGLSNLAYEWYYDERHVPKRLRRPFTGDGVGSGTWTDRPDHNKLYPEIAVPLELHPSFTIKKGQNQSIWVDVYIPKGLAPGDYAGTVVVKENGVATRALPVLLTVRNFTLPDKPSAQTMIVLGYEDLNRRYQGKDWFDNSTDEDKATTIRDKHFLIAHRHKLSLVGGYSSSTEMLPHWVPRLDGSLFTAKNGYDGPGVGVGNGIYVVGLYGGWQGSWDTGSESDMHQKSDYWVDWFTKNAPGTLYFLYLTDEPGSDGYAEVEQWSKWIDSNSGVGKNLLTFSTVSFSAAATSMPTLDIPCMWTSFGPTAKFQTDYETFANDASKRTCMYNGNRPASGSFATEDDGVALRVLAWTQYKFKLDFWFFWESTYYNDFQGTGDQTNLFHEARTFGTKDENDPIGGEQGWNYTNGDGVLFYPGTDTVFPADSYGVEGPFVSLRMKLWRRGIQDVDYLTLARQKNPTAVDALVQKMLPKVLWEYGVSDPKDPTWVKTEIAWSIDPDVWEAARKQLADIITGN
ncbi:MAG: DUF4091 domain-containing protein [Myxococcales bacterium]|nr:DUF4091 domain-containing protein [Myxococcales bacterium]